jgi:hypothetical protein
MSVSKRAVGDVQAPVMPDAENSQGRDSFLDDEDTENAACAAVSSAAARLQAALATTASGRGTLGALPPLPSLAQSYHILAVEHFPPRMVCDRANKQCQ